MNRPQMKAPGSGATGQAQGYSQSDLPIVDDGEGSIKHFKTLQAQAAAGGCGLYRLSDGAYLLTRWGLTRELPDLRAVSSLLSRMGVLR